MAEDPGINRNQRNPAQQAAHLARTSPNSHLDPDYRWPADQLYPHVVSWPIPHRDACPGCDCINIDDQPVYSKRTELLARTLHVPQELVEVLEIEFTAYGLTWEDTRKFIKSETSSELRGPLKDWFLKSEMAQLSGDPVALALRVAAKQAEIDAVRSVKGPAVVLSRNVEAERNLEMLWETTNFAQDNYGIERQHFYTIQESARQLGLTNVDIDTYIRSGGLSHIRGTISIFALKKKIRALNLERRGCELLRLSHELSVMKEW